MQRQIISSKELVITSLYGDRKKLNHQMVKKFHKGIDIRTMWDKPVPYNYTKSGMIVLPERAKLIRSGYQKKWGHFYVFHPYESGYNELKFIHVGPSMLNDGEIYSSGTKIGYSMLTEYMRKKGIGHHLHFETWWKFTHVDPLNYLLQLGIEYNFKKSLVENTEDKTRLIGGSGEVL